MEPIKGTSLPSGQTEQGGADKGDFIPPSGQTEQGGADKGDFMP